MGIWNNVLHHHQSFIQNHAIKRFWVFYFHHPPPSIFAWTPIFDKGKWMGEVLTLIFSFLWKRKEWICAHWIWMGWLKNACSFHLYYHLKNKFTSKSHLSNKEIINENDSLMIINVEETLPCLIFCLVDLLPTQRLRLVCLSRLRRCFKFHHYLIPNPPSFLLLHTYLTSNSQLLLHPGDCHWFFLSLVFFWRRLVCCNLFTFFLKFLTFAWTALSRF